MGCLFSWTRNESRLFFQNYRLWKEVTGRKCSEVETFEWRAGFKKKKKKWIEHRGVPEGQQTCQAHLYLDTASKLFL